MQMVSKLINCSDSFSDVSFKIEKLKKKHNFVIKSRFRTLKLVASLKRYT